MSSFEHLPYTRDIRRRTYTGRTTYNAPPSARSCSRRLNFPAELPLQPRELGMPEGDGEDVFLPKGANRLMFKSPTKTEVAQPPASIAVAVAQPPMQLP
jgi:hypothetical protein